MELQWSSLCLRMAEPPGCLALRQAIVGLLLCLLSFELVPVRAAQTVGDPAALQCSFILSGS